MEVGGI